MMELLAPAGSYEQAVSCLEAGANALYGGLTKWNARTRAVNFTLSQYKAVLELCHGRNAKFYLTLNTLLRNEELDDVKTLFESADFVLPDAVIVADIGLILYLREHFPNLPLHLSTQGGAVCKEDLYFWKNLGITRIILARELTLSEIKELKEQTQLEIEIFVFGSQCLSFSGQCLWGGILHGSSGNRGRCIGMCRDIYSCNGKKGDLLYPKDINAVDILGKIADIGVCSIKIEGRLRSIEETKKIVSFYRHSLNSLPNTEENEKTLNYHGYLDNVVPVKNMFALENPRRLLKKNVPPKKHDIDVHIKQAESVSSFSGKKLVFESDNMNDIMSAKENTILAYIYEIKKIKDFEEMLIAERKSLHTPIFYKLPILDFSGKYDCVLKKLQGHNIMLTKISQISFIKNYDFGKIWADYTLNAWNDTALQFLSENKIKAITVHPELSIDYYANVKSYGMKINAIASKKITLGYTRACFGEMGLCDSKCENTDFSIKNCTRDYNLKIFCDNDFGYRSIQTEKYCEPTTNDYDFLNGWIVCKKEFDEKQIIPIYKENVR